MVAMTGMTCMAAVPAVTGMTSVCRVIRVRFVIRVPGVRVAFRMCVRPRGRR